MIERSLEHWRSLPDLTLREAAEVLGGGVKSVRAAIARGDLDSHRRFGKIFVTVASVRKFANEAPETEEQSTPAPRRTFTKKERATMRSLQGGR